VRHLDQLNQHLMTIKLCLTAHCLLALDPSTQVAPIMPPSHSCPLSSPPAACPAPSIIPSPFDSSGLFDSTRVPALSSLDPVPDDVDVLLEDSSTTPIIDIQHKIKYPLKASGILPSPARAFDPAESTNPSASATRFGRSKRERFALSLDKLDPRIRAKLDQPFGKDNLTQCFYAEPAFWHTFVLLLKSGFLSNSNWAGLVAADPTALSFSQLFDLHAPVDFPLSVAIPSIGSLRLRATNPVFP